MLVLTGVVLTPGVWWWWRRRQTRRREDFIRHAPWPSGLLDGLRQRHPQLSPRDCELVGQGLRQFFLAHLQSGRGVLSMPSQVVDDLWHAYILHTRAYARYCQQAFGGFLHHTPALAMGGHRRRDAGLRRCWHWVCRQEQIDPRQPSRLPLLFHLDAKFAVAGGFLYVADCQGPRPQGAVEGSPYCGAELAGPEHRDGGGGGSGCSSSSEGDCPGADPAGAGDGGGDGGSGCGGGD
ncbi:hypothetical protein G3A44_04150 [Ideonella sp. TBM-1]|uniref:Uncharacterized protein n=1 Tax=Ideonella livida TaxID=2707176 RepID=A0A7C9TKK9_9BURK|nr:hypothetical protein [Ideonella livida]